MTSLPEFLLARIAEDEHTARSAMHAADWRVELNDHDKDYSKPVAIEIWAGKYKITDVTGPDWVADTGVHQEYDADHIVAWSPKRVIADCEKRREVVSSALALWASDAHPSAIAFAQNVLELLAFRYANHPDFLRGGWWPSQDRV